MILEKSSFIFPNLDYIYDIWFFFLETLLIITPDLVIWNPEHSEC